MKLRNFAFALALVSAFCAAASVAFAQDAPKEKAPLPKFKQDSLKLWLSPSNQIHNFGYGDYGTEKERMNQVADIVEPIVKAQGVKVYRNDPNESIKDYTRHANELGCDLYFAIHSNAFKGNARGTTAYCHRFGGEAERFTQRVHDALLEIYPGPDRKIHESYNRYDGKPMWEPGYSNMPACLVEIAFHDNKEDSEWILANMQQIGEALARAVLEHLAAEHPDCLEK